MDIQHILQTIYIECDNAGAVTHLTWGKAETPTLIGKNADAVYNKIEAYLLGKCKKLDIAVNIKKQGTPYQQTVWQALLTIPYGATLTYQQLAEKVGSHPRAIGGAVGKNPIPLIIPCHRILAKNGLGGYSAVGGVNIKTELLKLEQKGKK